MPAVAAARGVMPAVAAARGVMPAVAAARGVSFDGTNRAIGTRTNGRTFP